VKYLRLYATGFGRQNTEATEF